MGQADEGSNKWSFLSFLLSVLGFFLLSFNAAGGFLGTVAIVLSFLAEDIVKERSIWQYIAVIIAVVDILGALAGWNLMVKR